MKPFFLTLIFLFPSIIAFAGPKPKPKGILEELADEKYTTEGEQFVNSVEVKAIETIKKIISKKKGTDEEPQLLFRLGELYTRKAKSTRFLKGSIKDDLNNANTTFQTIKNKFPNFRDMDSVLFSQAFVLQQLNNVKAAKANYYEITEKFPNSIYIGDATLEIGEIFYNEGNFNDAIKFFVKVENYSNTKLSIFAKYKCAWAYYNIKKNKEAVEKLIEVAKQNDNHSLRKEALHDLTIFASEIKSASELYSFFNSITTTEELGESIKDLARLYESHSRYKEILVFTNQFIENNPLHSYRIQIEIILIDALEQLKMRKELLPHVTNIAKACFSNSDWIKANATAIVTESCDNYKSSTAELTKKWWDIWLKNKQHKEFTDLTRSIFEITTDYDNLDQPDINMHYAFAELLFQQNQFERAAEKYYFVSQKTSDKIIKHNSSYSALFSIEKTIEQQPNNHLLLELQKKYALSYIKDHPNEEHIDDVKFKLAILLYNEKNYVDAAKWLNETALSKNVTLKNKSEDLILDILNIQKNYIDIVKQSKKFSQNTKDEERIKSLNKIQIETEYSILQQNLEKANPEEGINLIELFLKQNPNTHLTRSVHQQIIAFAYKNNLKEKAIDSSLKYLKLYNYDNYSQTIQKELIKQYIDSNSRLLAAEQIIDLNNRDETKKNEIEYLLSAAELYKEEKNFQKFRDIYKKLIKIGTKDKISEYYRALYQSYSDGKNLPEFQQLKVEILKLNIEPMATEILNQQALSLLEQKKYSEAFDASKKIISRNVEDASKAPARLIQAKILENEFISQSTKTQSNKLALVLSIKTEKLDKVQTAYYSAIRMSAQAQVQHEAYNGLLRCYDNYISSIKNIQFTDSISEQEKAQLQEQLVQLYQPIESRKTEVSKKISEIDELLNRTSVDNKKTSQK